MGCDHLRPLCLHMGRLAEDDSPWQGLRSRSCEGLLSDLRHGWGSLHAPVVLRKQDLKHIRQIVC